METYIAELVSWIDSHQGFALALLTAVYVVATIVIVGMMFRANKISRLHLKHSEEMERGRIRPYVLFYLAFSERPGHIVDAVFRNIGKTSAYDVNVDITPEIRRFWEDGIADTSPTAQKFQFLAPGDKIEDSLGLIHDFHKKYPNPKFSGAITYKDGNGRVYSEPIELDYEYRKHIGISEFARKDIGKQLEEIGKEVRKLVNVIQKN